MNDVVLCIIGFTVIFGSLHLALRVPLRLAGTVVKIIKYGLIVNYVALGVLPVRILPVGDTREIMLYGGLWALIASLLMAGRADDYERSKNNCGHHPICKGVCKGGSTWRASMGN